MNDKLPSTELLLEIYSLMIQYRTGTKEAKKGLKDRWDEITKEYFPLDSFPTEKSKEEYISPGSIAEGEFDSTNAKLRVLGIMHQLVINYKNAYGQLNYPAKSANAHRKLKDFWPEFKKAFIHLENEPFWKKSTEENISKEELVDLIKDIVLDYNSASINRKNSIAENWKLYIALMLKFSKKDKNSLNKESNTSSIDYEKFAPYQRCPICNGAGDIYRVIEMRSVSCPTCKGERIIPMHQTKQR